MKGNLNHVTTKEAQEAPDMVMGMFPVNSFSAAVLFDSGASHFFVTKPFAERSGMKHTRMHNPMLVQIPGIVPKPTMFAGSTRSYSRENLSR